MKVSRRAVLVSALGAGVAAAVGALVIAGPGGMEAMPSGPARKGDRYAPGPRDRGRRGPGDMTMQLSDGRWHSHLLPFTQPFSRKRDLDSQLASARSRHLIG